MNSNAALAIFILFAFLDAHYAQELDMTRYFYQKPLSGSVEDFNSHSDWFAQPHKIHLIVVDDFYDQRTLNDLQSKADEWSFETYWPDKGPWSWNASCLYRRLGQTVQDPFVGEVFAPEEVRHRLELLVDEKIQNRTWRSIGNQVSSGDGWNGALHLMNERFGGAVHHHFKDGDLEQGWSGVLYLTPGIPEDSGTSIWRKRQTGKVVGNFGSDFTFDPMKDFELAYVVPAKANRLVLFREGIYHRVEPAFGSPHGPRSKMRLTQTFFFETVSGRPNAGEL